MVGIGVTRATSSWSRIMYDNPNGLVAYQMKRMSSHIRRLQRTLKMRMTCAMCYNLFKHSMNNIGSRFWGERLITSNMVIWTPKGDRHTTSVTKRNFSYGFCSRTFETLSRKGKLIIFLKILHDLVAVLPNHRTIRASANPLGVQLMQSAQKTIGFINTTSLILSLMTITIWQQWMKTWIGWN